MRFRPREIRSAHLYAPTAWAETQNNGELIKARTKESRSRKLSPGWSSRKDNLVATLTIALQCDTGQLTSAAVFSSTIPFLNCCQSWTHHWHDELVTLFDYIGIMEELYVLNWKLNTDAILTTSRGRVSERLDVVACLRACDATMKWWELVCKGHTLCILYIWINEWCQKAIADWKQLQIR